jgi:peptidoglycan/LPS O-acetylase OafA/YrhL
MKKDVSVELIIIFACLIVVGVHCWPGNMIDGNYDISRTFISCCLADGVAIFWMVAGFFIFQKYDYRKILARTGKKIVAPIVCMSILMFYFINDWMSGNSIQILSHGKEEYLLVWENLLKWQNSINGLEHFWYLYVYILLMLISPLIYAFIKYLDEDPIRVKTFLGVSLLLLIWNDASENAWGGFSHHTVNAMFPAVIEMLWGYFLYKYKEKFLKKRYIYTAVVGFVLLNVLRTLIQIMRYRLEDNPNSSIYCWYSSLGLLCSICVIVFCFAVVGNRFSKIGSKCIAWLGAFTFNIYLVHPVVIQVLNKYDFVNRWTNYVFGHLSGIPAEVVYIIVITFIVAGISLAVAFVIQTIQALPQSTNIIRKSTMIQN